MVTTDIFLMNTISNISVTNGMVNREYTTKGVYHGYMGTGMGFSVIDYQLHRS